VLHKAEKSLSHGHASYERCVLNTQMSTRENRHANSKQLDAPQRKYVRSVSFRCDLVVRNVTTTQNF